MPDRNTLLAKLILSPLSPPWVQNVVRPATAVTLIALALAPIYSWLFIFKLDWRLDGAAIAIDAVQVGGACGCVVYGSQPLKHVA